MYTITRHSPGELLKVRKSNQREQKSIPTLIEASPMENSEIRTNFRCVRWAEYGLGRKDGVSIDCWNETMKFDKIRTVEEQIETLVNRVTT